MPTMTITLSTDALTRICAAVGAEINAESGGAQATPEESKEFFMSKIRSFVREREMEAARRALVARELDIT